MLEFLLQPFHFVPNQHSLAILKTSKRWRIPSAIDVIGPRRGLQEINNITHRDTKAVFAFVVTQYLFTGEEHNIPVRPHGNSKGSTSDCTATACLNVNTLNHNNSLTNMSLQMETANTYLSPAPNVQCCSESTGVMTNWCTLYIRVSDFNWCTLYISVSDFTSEH